MSDYVRMVWQATTARNARFTTAEGQTHTASCRDTAGCQMLCCTKGRKPGSTLHSDT
jgi:hypothetical protein